MEKVMGAEQQSDDEERQYFGPCCCCESEEKLVRNIVILDKKSPTPGTGWGCLVCKLPNDGAVFVACDECIKKGKQPKWACSGADNRGRVLFEDLKGEYRHNMSLHGINLQ